MVSIQCLELDVKLILKVLHATIRYDQVWQEASAHTDVQVNHYNHSLVVVALEDI